MTLRVTTGIVTYAWGVAGPGDTITLPAGAMVMVTPGGPLESAIGRPTCGLRPRPSWAPRTRGRLTDLARER